MAQILDATLDDDSLPIIMEMLSSTLYSRPYEAVLREYISNGFDAHTAAGVVLPVRVTLDADELTIRDFGHGLDRDGLISTFTFGKSSKRGREGRAQIGGYGIGAKSAYAITRSFNVRSFHNGQMIQVTAMMDDSGVPKLIVSDPAPSDQPTGVEVVIPLGEGGSHRVRQAWTALRPHIATGRVTFNSPQGWTYNNHDIAVDGGIAVTDRLRLVTTSEMFSVRLGEFLYASDAYKVEEYPNLAALYQLNRNLASMRHDDTFPLDKWGGRLVVALPHTGDLVERGMTLPLAPAPRRESLLSHEHSGGQAEAYAQLDTLVGEELDSLLGSLHRYPVRLRAALSEVTDYSVDALVDHVASRYAQCDPVQVYARNKTFTLNTPTGALAEWNKTFTPNTPTGATTEWKNNTLSRIAHTTTVQAWSKLADERTVAVPLSKGDKYADTRVRLIISDGPLPRGSRGTLRRIGNVALITERTAVALGITDAVPSDEFHTRLAALSSARSQEKAAPEYTITFRADNAALTQWCEERNYELSEPPRRSELRRADVHLSDLPAISQQVDELFEQGRSHNNVVYFFTQLIECDPHHQYAVVSWGTNRRRKDVSDNWRTMNQRLVTERGNRTAEEAQRLANVLTAVRGRVVEVDPNLDLSPFPATREWLRDRRANHTWSEVTSEAIPYSQSGFWATVEAVPPSQFDGTLTGGEKGITAVATATARKALATSSGLLRMHNPSDVMMLEGLLMQGFDIRASMRVR